MRRTMMALAAATLLAGCSMGQDAAISEKAVDTFHSQINAGQFDAIYVASAPEMKKATSQPDFDRLMAAVHTKLGAYRSAKAAGWNDSLTASGHLMTLNYAASYDRGVAEESFVYRVDGDRAALIAYHVNSPALLLN